MNYKYKLKVHSGPEDIIQELGKVLPLLEIGKSAHEKEPHLIGSEGVMRYAMRYGLFRVGNELLAFSAQTATPTGNQLAKSYSQAIKAGMGNLRLMPMPSAGMPH